MVDDDLTERILAACFEVMNELGAGFLESVYQRALLIALQDKGLEAKPQAQIPVLFRNRNIGDFFADILVEDQVIVELKAVKNISPEHLAQVINYLKATGHQRGLLVNFGNPRLEFKRLSNYPQEGYSG